MNQRTRPILWLFLLSSLLPPPSSLARADGGTLCLRERAGNYQIAVFTAPTPLRAGPVDVSVLVQDAATGKQLSEARVAVSLTQSDRSLTYPATAAAATNKLFHAAQFHLPGPGRWNLRIDVEGPRDSATVQCEMEAAEPLPSGFELGPWIGWPFAVVILFGLHQLLVRRRSRR
jgi:hypothetical protein